MLFIDIALLTVVIRIWEVPNVAVCNNDRKDCSDSESKMTKVDKQRGLWETGGKNPNKHWVGNECLKHSARWNGVAARGAGGSVIISNINPSVEIQFHSWWNNIKQTRQGGGGGEEEESGAGPGG